MSSTIPSPDGKSWVMANTGQYGVYRVNYTEQNWKAIINQLIANHTVSYSIKSQCNPFSCFRRFVSPERILCCYNRFICPRYAMMLK
jgi:hypothetical protein